MEKEKVGRKGNKKTQEIQGKEKVSETLIEKRRRGKKEKVKMNKKKEEGKKEKKGRKK